MMSITLTVVALWAALGLFWYPTLVMAGRGRLRTINELLIESQSVGEDDLQAFVNQDVSVSAQQEKRVQLPNVAFTEQLAPKKKQLRTKRLRRTLGRDYDERWMSVTEPEVKVTEVKSKQAGLELLAELSTINASFIMENNNKSNNSQKAPGSATLTQGVAKVIEKWLLQRASCSVTFVWDDLGNLFWPRWVKRGVCGTGKRDLDRKYLPGFIPRQNLDTEDTDLEDTDDDLTERSCSWPAGMHCVPFDSHTMRVLRWHCYPRSHHAQRNQRTSNRRRGAGTGNGERKSRDHNQRKTRIKCSWIKVPYPVTSECYCSC